MHIIQIQYHTNNTSAYTQLSLTHDPSQYLQCSSEVRFPQAQISHWGHSWTFQPNWWQLCEKALRQRKKLSDRQRRKDKKSENNEETPWSERERKESLQSWEQVFPTVVHGGLHQSIYLLCNLWRTPHQSRWIYPAVSYSSCRGPAGTVLGWLQPVERITPWARRECKEGEAESYGVTTFPMVPEPLRVGRN